MIVPSGRRRDASSSEYGRCIPQFEMVDGRASSGRTVAGRGLGAGCETRFRSRDLLDSERDVRWVPDANCS